MPRVLGLGKELGFSCLFPFLMPPLSSGSQARDCMPGTEGARVGWCVRAWLLSWVLKDTKGFTGQNEEQGLAVSPEATSANTQGRRAPGAGGNSCRSKW